MSESPIQSALHSALRQILTPLVRLLLRNGVAYGDLAEWVKQIYVEVANESFTIPGRKQSTARIATLTGLTRKEVQRLSRESAPLAYPNDRYNRAARVISAWVRDARFHDPAGEEEAPPAELPFEGEPSFSALVKEHSGDIPPRAILDELERVGAVESRGERLRLLTPAYIPSSDDSEKIAILGRDVSDLIVTIDHNIRAAEPAYFQRKVQYNNIPLALSAQVRAQIGQIGQRALEEMDRVMAQADRDANPAQVERALAEQRVSEQESGERVRSGIGIYYFQSPFKQGAATDDESAEEQPCDN